MKIPLFEEPPVRAKIGSTQMRAKGLGIMIKDQPFRTDLQLDQCLLGTPTIAWIELGITELMPNLVVTST